MSQKNMAKIIKPDFKQAAENQRDYFFSNKLQVLREQLKDRVRIKFPTVPDTPKQ